MFTKRHYKAIAQAIKKSNAQGKIQLATDLAELFESDNVRFNITKFFTACGLTKESA